MRTCLPLAALMFFAIPTVAQPTEISNVTFQQKGNSVVITYDLKAEGEASIEVRGSHDGGRTWGLLIDHASGDIGDHVEPGGRRRILWDVLRDYPRGLASKSAVFELFVAGGEYQDPVTGMEFVFVKGGEFEMGDQFEDGGGDEKPVHRVTVPDFYLGKFEVTQDQWEEVMGGNPSYFEGVDRPVERVSWDDVQNFIEKLNHKTGRSYRLPTEAEWEYAARSGGKRERWAGNSAESELGEYAWYNVNSGGKTRPVGQKKPNGLGLYDMSGNVWEWCQDWYGRDSYAASPRENARGAGSGSHRVNRGGSWKSFPWLVRTALRDGSTPDARRHGLGFRLLEAGP